MATEVVHSLRASGGDYTDWASWEAAQQRNLVTADEIAVLECYDDWPSGYSASVLNLSGWTTDSTRYIVIRAAAVHGHDGTPGSGFFAAVTPPNNTTAVITNGQSYTRIIGLEVINTRAAGQFGINLGTTGAWAVAISCIGKTNAGTPFTAGYGLTYAAYRGTFIQCLAVDSPSGFGVPGGTNTRYNAYNCIASGCGTGFASGTSNKAALKNCVSYGSTIIGFENNVDATNSCNNASADSSASVFTDSVTGITSADFVDAANDDYHLASGSALIGAGADLSSILSAYGITTDIDGDSWPTSGAWDIGYDYYVAAGGVTLDGDDSTQSNASGAGDIAQSHILAGDNASQANASAAGSVSQTHVLNGDGSSQENTSSSGAIEQTHILGGDNSTQSAESSSGSISTDSTVFLDGDDVTQSANSSAGSIEQMHVLAGDNVTQSNASIDGGISIGDTVILGGDNASQANASADGSIGQTHVLNGDGSNQSGLSSSGAIDQTNILSGAGATQINLSSGGNIILDNESNISYVSSSISKLTQISVAHSKKTIISASHGRLTTITMMAEYVR